MNWLREDGLKISELEAERNALRQRVADLERELRCEQNAAWALTQEMRNLRYEYDRVSCMLSLS